MMLTDKAPLHHPAAAHTAKYCIKQIEEVSVLGGSTSTLHMLTMLKDVLGCFPKTQLKVSIVCVRKNVRRKT